MRDERFDLMDDAQLNFEDITGFSGRSIINISWSKRNSQLVIFR